MTLIRPTTGMVSTAGERKPKSLTGTQCDPAVLVLKLSNAGINHYTNTHVAEKRQRRRNRSQWNPAVRRSTTINRIKRTPNNPIHSLDQYYSKVELRSRWLKKLLCNGKNNQCWISFIRAGIAIEGIETNHSADTNCLIRSLSYYGTDVAVVVDGYSEEGTGSSTKAAEQPRRYAVPACSEIMFLDCT
ncbi:hypothetical protein J6590_015448 [Homalodisca vitripennis]|nr:hypothetical protein J6590_015448 [Homalodisca vitripennis]